MQPNPFIDWRTYVAGFAVAALCLWAWWPRLKEEWARWKH